MSANGKPSVVFCHGIWADGSSFSKLLPTLQAEGYQTIAVQYGLDTNERDVEDTLRTLGRVSSPAILVGHSYGGSVITAAGTDDRVAGLVYISALAPDEDETTQSQLEKFPVSDASNPPVAGSGCVPRAWSTSPAISRPRSRKSCGRPNTRRRLTCSAGTHPASPGRRSRAGTSSPPKTGLSSPISSGSWRSA